MKNNDLNKLRHPLFIASVLLLLLNDFYLKQAYGNVLTGKLSDFAGLFAFPFFFSCLFANHKKLIHLATVFLFVWWKSTFSQPYIDLVNGIGIPIGRVVDFSDNMALLSVLASYLLFTKTKAISSIKPIMKWAIISVSVFSFVATQLPPRAALEYTSVDKQYEFTMPIGEFIVRFNRLQKKEIEKMTCQDCYYGYFDEESQVFYSTEGDTLTYLIDIAKHKDSDTIRFNNYFAGFQIYSKNNDSTILKLIDIVTFEKLHKLDKLKIVDTTAVSVPQDISIRTKYGYPTWSLIKNPDNEILKQKAINEFEKRLIKKIK